MSALKHVSEALRSSIQAHFYNLQGTATIFRMSKFKSKILHKQRCDKGSKVSAEETKHPTTKVNTISINLSSDLKLSSYEAAHFVTLVWSLTAVKLNPGSLQGILIRVSGVKSNMLKNVANPQSYAR